MQGLENYMTITSLLLCFITGMGFILRGYLRSARDVALDMVEEPDYFIELDDSRTSENRIRDHAIVKELVDAGLFGLEDRRAFLFQQKSIPLVGAICVVFFCFFVTSVTPIKLLLATIFGLALGYIASRVRLSLRKKKFKRDVEFFLPVVMERIVMAVQSGLDVFPALLAVLEIEKEEIGGQSRVKLNPVSQLLERVCLICEAGVGFEKSLRGVAARINVSSLRHAFIHLGVAQREGGELVMPLKELSDATQLGYQELIEEEVAKMPVKATMPLLCTFAGLILCFLTAPLIQVINLVSKPVLP